MTTFYCLISSSSRKLYSFSNDSKYLSSILDDLCFYHPSAFFSFSIISLNVKEDIPSLFLFEYLQNLILEKINL